LKRGVINERFQELMTYQSERARKYYAEARKLLPLVEQASRPALWAMMEIYRRILEKIIRRGYDVFDERVCLSGPEKSAIALKAFAMRAIPWSLGTK
jgi:phytoene synthase